MIFSSENIIFLKFSIFSKYQPLLLVFTNISNSCISNTNCPSPYAIQWCKILPKNLTLCVGSKNVTNDGHRRTAYAIRRKYSLPNVWYK